ncbi:class I SAM-dependent methyltransferase [Sphingopyxis sp. PET50]|uniref:class I SAM-dependent methyltransferase n=1 Tax=Sphingopyxis sp. PET50 TaxID=2976533 RepID=UPI0021AF4615|nr:class I SAM-dependent methyltransferase [Sphingopyxis sp. PET50]
MTPGPWVPGDGGRDAKRHAPATERNRDAIAAVLADWLPPHGTVLEVASGSGEHVVHFAAAFPRLDWQPSDPDAAGRVSIAAWSAEAGLPNIAAPLALDATAPDWPVSRADAILCINMVHISPWDATLGLFAGAARLLGPGAPLILYGPYIDPDVPTAESNLAFDASLRARDPAWGLRDLDRIKVAATDAGLDFADRRAMPANNLMLLFRRRA